MAGQAKPTDALPQKNVRGEEQRDAEQAHVKQQGNRRHRPAGGARSGRAGSSQATVCRATSPQGTMRSMFAGSFPPVQPVSGRKSAAGPSTMSEKANRNSGPRPNSIQVSNFIHLTTSIEDDGLVQKVVQTDNLAVDPVVFHQLPQLLLAVGARRHAVLSAGGANLLGLEPVRRPSIR